MYRAKHQHVPTRTGHTSQTEQLRGGEQQVGGSPPPPITHHPSPIPHSPFPIPHPQLTVANRASPCGFQAIRSRRIRPAAITDGLSGGYFPHRLGRPAVSPRAKCPSSSAVLGRELTKLASPAPAAPADARPFRPDSRISSEASVASHPPTDGRWPCESCS